MYVYMYIKIKSIVIYRNIYSADRSEAERCRGGTRELRRGRYIYISMYIFVSIGIYAYICRYMHIYPSISFCLYI